MATIVNRHVNIAIKALLDAVDQMDIVSMVVKVFIGRLQNVTVSSLLNLYLFGSFFPFFKATESFNETLAVTFYLILLNDIKDNTSLEM